MDKWKKRVCILCMTAVILVLCCSCGMLYDIGESVLAQQTEAAPTPTKRPRPLPTLPQTAEETPQPEETYSAQRGDEDFELLVDPESLLSGESALTLPEADADASYSVQADGTYLKETPFMGKDGGVILAFGSNGKNDYVNYFYSGDLKTITPLLIVKEFTALLHATQQKYGTANIHLWSLSPTGDMMDMAMVGEFTQEDITDAVLRNRTAGFQYAWRRVGDNIVYITLFLDGQGNYAVDFVYDNTQTSSLPAYGI
ncbi:MAG: hypothetical protein VB081_08600 [Christensenella sp.]|uniref:hypothetical protein n=1 Tax=Christensenella sp. TaxID=1935934 RepID=UPI002B200031|nr:hypothetical protein [Christensenella sp.]MEA5003543.1 hypothetical protein [Christensenella sp.]